MLFESRVKLVSGIPATVWPFLQGFVQELLLSASFFQVLHAFYIPACCRRQLTLKRRALRSTAMVSQDRGSIGSESTWQQVNDLISP